MAGQTDGSFRRSLADRVRFARRVAGMSRRAFAAAIDSCVSRVRRYESGEADISAAVLLRIAVTLDVPPGWLYGIDDNDHWPDTQLTAMLQDPQMPDLVSAFTRITDAQARRRVLALARDLADRRGGAVAPPPEAAPAPTGGRQRILLVDDAPDVLLVVGAFLRSGGYEVVRAHDAEAALDIIGGTEALDVLVTDYAMPGMSGLELARRTVGLRAGLAVVVITAYAADLALAAGRPAGTVVLAKPFARADLLNAIRSVCAGSVDAAPL